MATDIIKASYDRRPQEGRECVGVSRYDRRAWASREDCVAVEEPLEIRLGYRLAGRPAQKSLSVTMRTPGADRALAAGFLYGEGIISSREDVEQVEVVAEEANARESNILRVHMAPHVEVDTQSMQRHFYTTSSCGVCGKASLEALRMDDCDAIEAGDFTVPAQMICALPERLRTGQEVFDETGGLHAAGLFDADGALLELHEDVGRHNALDKLVGARLLAGELPLDRSIVVLSGRASFELLQKALRARAQIVVAVGAPSSLAVRLAEDFGITLIGFARRDRLNVYSHAERIAG
jgi:FdhD protein